MKHEPTQPVEQTGGTGGAGGAGYSGPALERAQLLLDDLESPLPQPRVQFEQRWAWGTKGAKQASPNHEAEAWNNEAVRAALHGTPAQFNTAAQVLLDAYYPRELGTGAQGIGLGAGEVLVPDNHTHQHLVGVGMGRIAAVLSGRKELMEKSGELLRAWSSALQALATPAPYYFVGSAGYRSPHMPLWFYGTAWLRQVLGQPGPLPEFVRKPQGWRDPAAACVRAIRYLQSRGPDGKVRDDLAGASKVEAAGVKLKTQVLVYRKDGDRHLVVIPRPKGGGPADGVCDWLEVPHGLSTYKATMSGCRAGFNWQTKPPDPPKGAYVVEFPSTWG